MATDLKPLMEKLGYQFKNKKWLVTALRHRSVGRDNNERLEFLGDAILSFTIAAELFNRQPDLREGELSRLRSDLVNGEIIAKMALDLQLDQFVEVGGSELKSGGQARTSILADTFEAVIGAIYEDGGIRAAQGRVLYWYENYFADLSQVKPQKDPKTTLQEWLQARRLPLPIYEMTATGAAHAQTFYVICRVEGLKIKSEGESTSRRKAEQIAAAKFLEQLDD